MQGISTLTQKGQITIPKSIRDHFKLKPSDKLHFSVYGGNIVAKPVLSIEQMFGSIKTKKPPLTKKAMKTIISDAVLEKFKQKEDASHT